MSRGAALVAFALLVLPALDCTALGAGEEQATIPSRKAGLWQLTMAARGRPDVTLLMCIDTKTDREMLEAWLSPVTKLCPEPTWRRQESSIVIEADCRNGGRTIVSRAELSGDFDREHTLRINSKSGVGAAGEVQLTQTMRYVSEVCTGGLIPGGVQLPNGAKMNMKRMMKLIENMNENGR